MWRPKSHAKYQTLRASQALGGQFFAIGFHYFYTQFYTQPNTEQEQSEHRIERDFTTGFAALIWRE
jgi:hypothetical protein